MFQITHWQSPYMHAYFPALNSYPSLLGDMLANGVNCLGFTWVRKVPGWKMALFVCQEVNKCAPLGVLLDGHFLKQLTLFLLCFLRRKSVKSQEHLAPSGLWIPKIANLETMKISIVAFIYLW